MKNAKWILMAGLLLLAVVLRQGLPEEIRENEPIKYECDEVIKVYMDAIAHCDAALIYDLTPYGCFGCYNDSSDEKKAMVIAENAGEVTEENKRLAIEEVRSIIELQRSLILESWGDNAFRDYSYEKIKTRPLAADNSHDAYFVKATGQEISFEEYQELNREYWADICDRHNIKLEDLNKPEFAYIYLKYIDDIPTSFGSSYDTEAYIVHLTFAGKNAAENHNQDFRFIIENINGSWFVQQGITWANYYDESPEIELYP